MKTTLPFLKLTACLICLLAFLPFPSNSQTTYFSEGFSSGSLPSGWSNDSLGLPAIHLWMFNNPYSRTISGAGFDSTFAIFDSDEGSTNDNVDELATLTTPSISLSGVAGALFLELDEQYRGLTGPTSGGSSRSIQYSIDGGASWVSLVYDSVDLGYPNPAVHSMYDITAVAGSSSIMFRFTWTGSWDWWWAIDNVTVKDYPANCNTPPNAGITIASDSMVCGGDMFQLSLSGADSLIGNTWQWQESADGINFTDITGEVSNTCTHSQTAESWYQCVITCSGQSSASVPVHVLQGNYLTCYCNAVHIVDCSAVNSAITNVSITGTTLDKTSGCDQITGIAYTIWPIASNTTADLTRNLNYQVNVTTDNDDIISVWFDWNEDGVFGPLEWTQVCTTSVAGVANSVNIIVPGSAVVGPTGMRVRSRLLGNINDASSACLDFGSGETEDYIVGIDYSVGIIRPVSTGELTLYPNPASNTLTVFLGGTIGTGTLEISDISGRKVLVQQVSGVYSAKLDITSLPAGVYSLKLLSGDKNVDCKFVVQH